MTRSDNGLKSIVADMHDEGYSDCEIAVAVDRSERRIGQILHELKPRPPKITSIEDLPHHWQERIRNWQSFSF